MPPRRSVSGSHGAPGSSRAGEMSTEVLYNTAVQSFVRRDHVKTQATLARLLAQLRRPTSSSSDSHQTAWYDLDGPVGGDGDELLMKTLKLVISANTSLYTDPPHNTAGLPEELIRLLPPSSAPDQILAYTQSQLEPYCPGPSPDQGGPLLLPPALLLTLLLASLKLKPARESLNFVHHLSEEWFGCLPDAFVLAISPCAASPAGSTWAERKKRVEGAREGYLKVVELFVGEVLAREGEFEMARAFLDGEIVMSSKRKESLYRHLRSAETRASASPSSSLILPSPSSSGVLVPSASPSPSGSRSRSASTSSSSSEATARPQLGPGTSQPLQTGSSSRVTGSTANLRNNTASNGIPRQLSSRLGGSTAHVNGKGKNRAATVQDPGEEQDEAGSSINGTAPSLTSESTLPSKIYVNHPGESTSDGGRRDTWRGTSRGQYRGSGGGGGRHRDDRSSTSAISSALSTVIRATLPAPLARRLSHLTATLGRYAWLGLALPVPIMLLFALMVWVRRKQQRLAIALAAGAARGMADAAAPLVATASPLDALAVMREKIRRAREQGLMSWLKWFVRWWIDKFVGVWRMGTTITYV